MEIDKLYKIFLNHPNITIDSRSIKKNSIFFSLKGNNFNGNKFARESLNNGCKYAIIDEKKYLNKNCILVKDTKETLQKLAAFHRKKLNIPLIGITGTNGKTTTKELVSKVLSSKYKCYSTDGNLNNQIGVPISILEIRQDHEIAVIEMGANKIGEIKNLCKIAQPEAGIITNIGKVHLEGFGNYNGIIKAKTELYDYLYLKKGIVFVNNDDKLLIEKSSKLNTYSYGNEINSSIKSEKKEVFPFLKLKIDNTLISSNLTGEFQYYNIMAACAIGTYYNISINKIKKSIESYIPKNNRTEIVKTKKNFIILDAYNANPSSMSIMIDSFQKLNKKNKLCILGEMRELGKYSEEEHNKIYNKLVDIGIETIYIGDKFNNITENHYANIEDFILNMDKYNLTNRSILIKGSRSVYLEKVVSFL